MLDEIHSLARLVGASPADVLVLAQLAAGDAPINRLEDLSPAGLAEVRDSLLWYGRVRADWDSVLSYYEDF